MTPLQRPRTLKTAAYTSCKYRHIFPATPMPEKSSGPWKETFYIASLPLPVHKRDLLLPPCTEKSSGPWKGTFNISPCRKSLLDPGRRPFLHSLMPGKVFRSLEGFLLHSPMPEKSSSPWTVGPCSSVIPFFWPWQEIFCTFLHAGKVFRSLAEELLHSPMPE
jgi:hypothetical protein